ncbi:MAG: PQQ-binding-like beta-propeller repeat protein [Verrucomicrobiales bacterium]|nr:PQQ-binding-like beta-propeller repeat protein [Verrucomicrobiales bacterium]
MKTAVPVMMASTLLSGLVQGDAGQLGGVPWVRELPSGIYDTPAIGRNGTLFVATGGTAGSVFALDCRTGRTLWAAECRDTMASPVAGNDGIVFVAAGDGKVRALDGGTGRVIWTSSVAVRMRTCAVGFEGTVYVGVLSPHNIVALDGMDGALRWDFQPQTLWGNQSPAIGNDGTVHVAGYALDGMTGARLWDSYTETYGSSPAIGADGTIYAGNFVGQLSAIEGRTGAVLWQADVGNGASPVISAPAIGNDGTVFVDARDGWVTAFDGATGHRHWNLKILTEGNYNRTPAVAGNGTLYFADSTQVLALEGATGRRLWNTFVRGVALAPTIGVDGTIYVATRDGFVYALRGNSPLAASSWPKAHGDLGNTGRTRAKPPKVERQPEVVVLQEGEEGRVVTEVSGIPFPQVQWSRNGTRIPDATSTTVVIPEVTRADEGSYSLSATNGAGQTTSRPITVVVSNVDPIPLVALEWQGQEGEPLTLESADRVGKDVPWKTVRDYPAGNVRQWFLEPEPVSTSFFRLRGSLQAPSINVGWVNAWSFDEPIGTGVRIEYLSTITGWTEWQTLTNLVLPTSPYQFVDLESLDDCSRVYRTTLLP